MTEADLIRNSLMNTLGGFNLTLTPLKLFSILSLVGVVSFILPIAAIILMMRSYKRGDTLKQSKFLQYGLWIWVVGLIVMACPPILLGIPLTLNSYNINLQGLPPARFSYDTTNLNLTGERIWLILALLGFCLMIVGFRFATAAYKREDETPDWIKNLLEIFK